MEKNHQPRTCLVIVPVLLAVGVICLWNAPSVDAQASGEAAQTLVLAESVPLFGTYYSLTLLQPPFPFNPFPELPVYELGKGVYAYDDRQVDYVALRAFQSESSFAALAAEGGGGAQTMSAPSPPPPGGGGGGSGGGGGISNPPPYSVAGLKLTIPTFTNGYIYTTIFEHNPALAYDVYSKTNLNSTNWLFGVWGVVGQTNYYLLQSSFPGNVFLIAANNLDSDGDGMPDNWEAAYGLNPNSAADAAQDSDSDGLTNLQEFQQGSNPVTAPAFQVMITTPRTLLP